MARVANSASGSSRRRTETLGQFGGAPVGVGARTRVLGHHLGPFGLERLAQRGERGARVEPVGAEHRDRLAPERGQPLHSRQRRLGRSDLEEDQALHPGADSDRVAALNILRGGIFQGPQRDLRPTDPHGLGHGLGRTAGSASPTFVGHEYLHVVPPLFGQRRHPATDRSTSVLP